MLTWEAEGNPDQYEAIRCWVDWEDTMEANPAIEIGLVVEVVAEV